MRCFIGILLPSEIRDYLFTIQKQIGQDYAKITWVAKKNLHLTLKFLGYPDEETLRLTRNILRSIQKPHFTVELGAIGWFPSDEKPRVVWIDLFPKKELMELHGDIELGFGSLFSRDERFAVHLTIGRIKRISQKEPFFHVLRDIHPKKYSFSITSFCLMKSILTASGPHYSILEEYPLD